MDGSESDDEAFDTAPSTPAELSETECNSPALQHKYKENATNVCPDDRHQRSRRSSNKSDATEGKPDRKDPNETVTVANSSDTYTETESEGCDSFPIHKDNAREVRCPDSDDVGDDHLNLCNPSSESTSEDAEKDKGDDKQQDAARGTNAITIISKGIPTKTQPSKSAQSRPDSSEIQTDMIGAVQNKNEDTFPNKQIEATGKRSSTENIVQATGAEPEIINDSVVVQGEVAGTDTTCEDVGKKTPNKLITTKEPRLKKRKKKEPKISAGKKEDPNSQEADYPKSEDSNHHSSDNKSSSENEYSNGKDYTEGGRQAADLANSFVSIPSLRDASEENPQGIFVLDYFAVSADNSQDTRNTSENKQPDSKALSPLGLQVSLKRELPTATCEQPSEIMQVAEDLLSPCHLVSEKAAHCLEKLFIKGQNPEVTGNLAKSIPGKSQDLFDIIQIILRKIVSDEHDVESENFRRQCILQLFACCAFLSHQEPLTEARKSQLDQSIRGHSGNRRCSMALRPFFDEFTSAAKSTVTEFDETCELGVKRTCRKISEMLKKKRTWLKEASMVQLAQRCFSLMNKIARAGWDPLTKKLTAEILTVIEVVSKRGNNMKSRTVFDAFLVRGLAVLLWTCFNEDPKVTYRHLCNPLKLIADLLRAVFQSAKNKHRHIILAELHVLLSHPSTEVRKMVIEAIEVQDQSLAPFLLSNTEKQLRMAGFCIDDNTQPALEGNNKRHCAWHTTFWRGPDKQLLRGAMRTYCRGCLQSGSSDQCPKASGSSRQRSEQHVQNLHLLRQLGQRPCFVQLWAFQTHPLPQFYITDCTQDKLLLDVLVNDRLPCPRLEHSTLLSAATQVLSAIGFLASRGIALRDVTSSNLVCQFEAVNGKKEMRAKIADLGMSHVFTAQRAGAASTLRPLRNPGPCPVRWMSPESLFEGKFSAASMVYSFGYLLYELFTRGCQPFSETHRGTDDILRLLFLHSPSVRPFQWPCIPDWVFAIIRGCTEFRTKKRWSQKQAEEMIQKLTDSNPTSKLQEFMTFPQINIDQEVRKYLPEKGVPRIVQSMIGNPNKYTNLMKSSWPKSSAVKVTELETHASDSFSVVLAGKAEPTTVNERLTSELNVDDLESTRLPSVQWSTCLPMATDGQEGLRLQVRKYPSSETLLEAAKRSVQSMTDHVDLMSEELCKLCLQLAIEVRSLHDLNWIHRDLRCKNVLITHKSKQMLFARISRMVELKSSVFCGEVFKDSIRWAAPEVVHNGVYSKKSDIFSLVTTFFELFHVAYSCRTILNPHHLSFFPLANVEIDGMANLVHEGVLLPQPQCCPDELYNLICDGRNPDCQARPDIAAVIDRLQKLCAPFGVTESECPATQSTHGEKAPCRSRDVKNKAGIRRVVNKIRTKLRRESENELANCFELGYISAERLESLKSKTNAEAVDESSQKDRYNNNNTPLNAGTTNTVLSTQTCQTSLRDTVPRFPSEKKKPSGPLPPIPSDHAQNEGYENQSTEYSLQMPVARSTCKTRREYFPFPIPSVHSQNEAYENHWTEDSLQKPVGISTSTIRKRFFPPPPDSEKDNYENVSDEDSPSSSQGQECVLGSMAHARIQEGSNAWNKQSCSDMASNPAISKLTFCPIGHQEIRKVTAWGDVTSPCHQCLQMMYPSISTGLKEQDQDQEQDKEQRLYCLSLQNRNLPLASVEVYENSERLDHAALTESPVIAPHPREMYSNLSGSSTSCSVPNAYENLAERDCADDENPYEPYVNNSQDRD